MTTGRNKIHIFWFYSLNVIGFFDLADLWVIKIKKSMILCARRTSRSREQSTKRRSRSKNIILVPRPSSFPGPFPDPVPPRWGGGVGKRPWERGCENNKIIKHCKHSLRNSRGAQRFGGFIFCFLACAFWTLIGWPPSLPPLFHTFRPQDSLRLSWDPFLVGPP